MNTLSGTFLIPPLLVQVLATAAFARLALCVGETPCLLSYMIPSTSHPGSDSLNSRSLKQLHIELPHQVSKGQIELAPRQTASLLDPDIRELGLNTLHTQTVPRSFRKRHQVLVEFVRIRLHPPLWYKNLWIGENIGVLEDKGLADANDGLLDVSDKRSTTTNRFIRTPAGTAVPSMMVGEVTTRKRGTGTPVLSRSPSLMTPVYNLEYSFSLGRQD